MNRVCLLLHVKYIFFRAVITTIRAIFVVVAIASTTIATTTSPTAAANDDDDDVNEYDLPSTANLNLFLFILLLIIVPDNEFKIIPIVLLVTLYCVHIAKNLSLSLHFR